ncbi:Peptidase M23 [Methylocella silvestris BL2]|uniref:Peptidase M23 n=1 Tax=Methylocella silvestris (strain DSM 15510 / CIP 108128 / LMG 27833 / NCIMB 13906 / BL2) TaxID=395965 RepID=B8ENA3_METSB|nr:peptidoglycan DD-metalloendopeptidase family protein [Methylocella silvestris]ACK49616.1 Peptidase M23 [Methylocella silvestris BL2]
MVKDQVKSKAAAPHRFGFALACCVAGAASVGFAQTAAPNPPAGGDAYDMLSGRRLELRGMQDTIGAAEEQRAKIESEAASIRTDRAKLTTALVDLVRQIDDRERAIAEAEQRLDTLTGSEEAIRRSLASRRSVITEVLASLQRMGRKPPPALLVAPDDMLAALRASMMLGAVLPEMRAETEALASDLSDLLQLRKSIAAERDSLANEVNKLGLDRQRLAALIDARQAALAAAEKALSAENVRAAELARQAASLKDLIARMESEVAAAGRAAEEARKADEAQKAAQAAAPEAQRKIAMAPFKDPARLAPASAFADTKGMLPTPVAGGVQRSFGAPDGFGGTEKGMLIATRANAIVVSPADGWAAYAGPYRSYGQVLIINAGQGYYIILAGMDRINVNVGQFLVAGEPVAVMGDGSAKTAAAIAIGAAQPILYIEFRKDGAAIDPGPWWAKPELQKVRG